GRPLRLAIPARRRIVGRDRFRGFHCMTDDAKTEPRGVTVGDAADFVARLAPGRLIGIDAGTKTLGLALSDVTRTIGSALETIRRTKFKDDAKRLLDLAREHAVQGFVLGLPANLDGS